jgi:hypothetical protein
MKDAESVPGSTARHSESIELGSTAIGLFLGADLRSAPSGFPWPEGERSAETPARAR